MKTVATESATSCGLALSTGVTAAMALPPQIDVPTAISQRASRETPNSRPRPMPSARPAEMPTTVRSKPSAPARSTCRRFMPPPMPTMATPSSVPLNFEVRARNGLPNSRA